MLMPENDSKDAGASSNPEPKVAEWEKKNRAYFEAMLEQKHNGKKYAKATLTKIFYTLQKLNEHFSKDLKDVTKKEVTDWLDGVKSSKTIGETIKVDHRLVTLAIFDYLKVIDRADFKSHKAKAPKTPAKKAPKPKTSEEGMTARQKYDRDRRAAIKAGTWKPKK